MMESAAYNELRRNRAFSVSIILISISSAALYLPFFHFADLSGSYFLSLDQIKTACHHTYSLFNEPCDYAAWECSVYHTHGRNCLFLWGMQIFFGFILAVSLVMLLACLVGVLMRRVKRLSRGDASNLF